MNYVLDNTELTESILDELLPSSNKLPYEPYDQIQEDLIAFGLTTTHELRLLMEKHLEEILKIDRTKAAAFKESPLYDHTPFHQAGGILGHVGLVREALALEFGDAWRTYQSRF